jgi:hypothetical protein
MGCVEKETKLTGRGQRMTGWKTEQTDEFPEAQMLHQRCAQVRSMVSSTLFSANPFRGANFFDPIGATTPYSIALWVAAPETGSIKCAKRCRNKSEPLEQAKLGKGL